MSKLKNFYLELYSTKHKEIYRQIGDYLQYFGIFVVIVCSFYFKDIDIFLKFIPYYVFCILLAWVLKGVFNNRRPNEFSDNETNPKNEKLKLEWSVKEGNSFPSGHTASSMTAIYLFQIDFVLGVIGLCVGIFTAWTRLINRKHWLRDVGFSIVADIVIYYIMFI